MAIISGFNNFGAPVEAATLPEPAPRVENIEKIVVPEEARGKSRKLTVKERVESFFADIPIMIDIAECESHFRQTNSDGEIFRGMRNPADVGVMQINEKYHSKTAKRLGLNIYTLEGNLTYARYLYENEGARPWLPSSQCWARFESLAKI